jgi:predicted ATPase
MMHVEGYRSVRDVWLRLHRVNVIVGPNGCGKSNLYRGLYLIACAANGQFSRAIADEGGMPSVLWAGERGKSGRARMMLKVQMDQLKYKLTCGLRPHSPGDTSAFTLDPDIKEEEISFVDEGKQSKLLTRENSNVQARDFHGKRIAFPGVVTQGESVLSALRQPHLFPEISALRQEILSWRFYHQFRTDGSSPIRQMQTGVMTPILNHEGTDLAAALQTIIEIGDCDALFAAIDRAFPGSQLAIECDNGRFAVGMSMPGIQRAFAAKELSDGTLHYLCLLAALLSPRPPALLALNEPETSIHPDLFESLARLIAEASHHSQLWITTHSQQLADYILEYTGAAPIELHKVGGATRVVGAGISHLHPDFMEPLKRFRRNPAIDRQMLRRRLHVLTNGYEIHI